MSPCKNGENEEVNCFGEAEEAEEALADNRWWAETSHYLLVTDYKRYTGADLPEVAAEVLAEAVAAVAGVLILDLGL